MVMPCSRSARRPSDSAARSATPSSSVTASRWSNGKLSVSCSSRPISVLLPSSTEPAVVIAAATGGVVIRIPLALAVLHRGRRRSVVGAGFAAFGDGGRRDLGDHPLDVGGLSSAPHR